MTTELDKRTAKTADLIVDEFIRLSIDTDTDPISGLMAAVPNVVADTICIVAIYDDHVSGFYDGEKVLGLLKGFDLGDISLDSESTNNVWQKISEASA